MKGPLAALIVALASAPALAAPIVSVETGHLEGASADGVSNFKGIPYAAPPVGDLRWRAPKAAARWTGVREATRYGPICMQKAIKDNGVGVGPASEDCLTLNVFTAQLRGRAPVMVWIHGGGLVDGSGTAALYDGAALARQGVVVVTLNYRLGRFGFFAHPALSAEQRGKPLANYGLMDQIAALKWVRRNIAAFGGDSRQVTIFGESAGGASVIRLMMMPQARGLFVRAIVESGGGPERSETLAKAEQAGAAFAAKLGVAGNDLAQLRAIPAQAIVAAGDLDVAKGEAPILDGVMLREDPASAFAAHRIAKVPLMIGSNSLEFPPMYVRGVRENLVKLFSDRKARLVAAYGSEDRFDDRIVSDFIFGAPARAFARDDAEAGVPTWLYRFSVVSAKAPAALQGGAVHASERQYVFDNLSASPWPTDAQDESLAETISAYWVAFAMTGDPNGAARPRWPRYGQGDELMDFTNDGPVVEKTPDAAVLDLIVASIAEPH